MNMTTQQYHEALQSAYIRGLRRGITKYAYTVMNGNKLVQVVGQNAYPLSEALARIDEEYGKVPAEQEATK